MEQPIKDFDVTQRKLRETYLSKNRRYGNSFDKSIDRFGIIAAVVRINDKTERLSQLTMGVDESVDESFEDTLLDLANYATMAAAYIERKRRTISEDF